MLHLSPIPSRDWTHGVQPWVLKMDSVREERSRVQNLLVKLEARLADEKSRTEVAETQLGVTREKLALAESRANEALASKEREWEARMDSATSGVYREVKDWEQPFSCHPSIALLPDAAHFHPCAFFGLLRAIGDKPRASVSRRRRRDWKLRSRYLSSVTTTVVHPVQVSAHHGWRTNYRLLLRYRSRLAS